MVTLKCETIKIPRNEYIYIYIVKTNGNSKSEK